MFRKEFKEATKLFFNFNRFFIGITLLSLLIIKLVLAIHTSLDEMIELLIHPVLLIQAFIMGATLFSREQTEGAIEYMLSLPLDRGRLLICKILPRLFYLFVTLAIYTPLALTASGFRPLLEFPSLIYIYFSVFFVACSLSMNRFKGAASVFRSFFHFLWISTIFVSFFYLAVYWQFAIKDQQNYFRTEELFSMIVVNQPHGLLATFMLFSLLLVFIFFFRFKRTDLKNHGALSLLKFIRFVPLFIFLFFFCFFYEEYWQEGPNFRFELAGDKLLQSNGYDIFIHDKDGQHRLNLQIVKQSCRLFYQPSQTGNTHFVWDGRTLYRIDPGSYRTHIVYSMNELDESLFIRKSGSKFFLCEAGASRIAGKQRKKSSRLVTIDLETGKHNFINADFITYKPTFIYSSVPNQNSYLSEILTFKDDQIQSVDLKTGAVHQTEKHINDMISAIKKVSNKPFPYQHKTIIPLNKGEVLLGLRNQESSDMSIFFIDNRGQATPWLPNYYHEQMPELIQEVIYHEAFFEHSFTKNQLLSCDSKGGNVKVLFTPSEMNTFGSRFIDKNEYFRSEEGPEILYISFSMEDGNITVYQIQNNVMKPIVLIPGQFTKDNELFGASQEYFQSSFSVFRKYITHLNISESGIVLKYFKENNYRYAPSVPSLRFNPWRRDYIVRVFAYNEEQEIVFKDLNNRATESNWSENFY